LTGLFFRQVEPESKEQHYQNKGSNSGYTPHSKTNGRDAKNEARIVGSVNGHESTCKQCCERAARSMPDAPNALSSVEGRPWELGQELVIVVA
jgi:hypothetical protein